MPATSQSRSRLDAPIYLLTAIAFTVGLVELVIGGTLDLIADDLGVTEGRAGLLITAFALVFAISGPVLLYLVGRFDRRRVTLAALAVFIAGNVVAVLGDTYAWLMVSRVITAASGGLLTVLGLTLAARLSSPAQRGRAIGLVVMGISGSIVLGLPIGVSMGHAFGWRSPFVLVIGLALVLMVVVALRLGAVATQRPAPLAEQVAALRNGRVLSAHLTTFFFLAGHYTLYGYLTPFVIETMGFGGGLITTVYFVFGAAAVLGGGVAGALTDKVGPRPTLLVATALFAGCLLLIPHATDLPAVFWVVLAVWGALSWAITPPIQSHLVRLAPHAADTQQSVSNSLLHLGIALGSLIGSAVIDRFDVTHNARVGALFVVIAFLTAVLAFRGGAGRRPGRPGGAETAGAERAGGNAGAAEEGGTDEAEAETARTQ
ncbi:MAG TPA: MFS transporter [Actinomycetaceae bacterium]|nr:MFS transporter [Actinomycetaceae bacterium]